MSGKFKAAKAPKVLRRHLGVVPVNIETELAAFKGEFLSAQKGTKFSVFLCGPSHKDKNNPGTPVRREILKRLKKEGIEVILGEDDGLENTRYDLRLNAQDNELEIIRRYCDAVVLIAASVGSFCELGLFSWHHSHDDGVLKRSGEKDFIVLISKKFRRKKSYLTEGPARAIRGFGIVEFIDFERCEIENTMIRLLERRATRVLDRRGRPPGPR